MKSFIVTALAAAVVAMPQNGAIPAGMTGVPKFPSCGMPCFTKALSPELGKCGIKIACYCGTSGFADAMSGCIPKSCKPDETKSMVGLANKMCDGSPGYKSISA